VQRRYRLRQAHDFRRLRETGQAYHHAWLLLSRAKGGTPHNRYGVITAKRLGNAVIRNRVRRRLKEALRLLHPRLKQGYDLVLIARPAITGQSFAAIQRIVLMLCEQAGLVGEDTTP
jgi:ribonuclease P protein component